MDYRVDFEYVVPEYGEMYITADSEEKAKLELERRFEEDDFFSDAEELEITKVEKLD